jgi:hypothetical protein
LGWKEVEVEVKEVKKGEEELLLIHFNKQRIKSFKELISEYLNLIIFTEKDRVNERI